MGHLIGFIYEYPIATMFIVGAILVEITHHFLKK